MSRLSKGFGSILNDRPHNAFVKDDISYKHKSDRGEGLGDRAIPERKRHFLLISSLRAQFFLFFLLSLRLRSKDVKEFFGQ